jgi:hypothetical protein
MSLLNQESGEEIDDAARGEEFTKGSSHVVWAAIIATVLVVAVVGVILLVSSKPIVTGDIVQVWAHPNHVETSGIDANGHPMPKESFDQVLLFAHVTLQNHGKVPLALENLLANAKLGDGVLSISAGSPAQYEEVFLAFPELASLHFKPLNPRAIIAPGGSVDGTTFWVVRLTKREWDARKDLNFTVVFQYQPSLVLAPRKAIIVQ